MKKNILRVFVILTTIIYCLIIITNTCFGTINPNKFYADEDLKTGELTNIGTIIATSISTVGVFVSVIILMVLGIKYMIGSAEERAEYKKTMIPYLIGAVLLFAASGIVQIIVDFGESDSLNANTLID